MEFKECTDNTKKSVCGTIFRKTNGILLFVCIHCTTFEFDSLIEYTIHINTHFPANNCEEVKLEKVEYESDGEDSITCDNEDRLQNSCPETFKRIDKIESKDEKVQIGLENNKDYLKQVSAVINNESQNTELRKKTKKKPNANNKSTGHNDIKNTSPKEDFGTNKNKNSYKYTCDYCKLQIKYKSDIVKHMKNEHSYTRIRAPLAQSTVCNFCGKLVKPSRFAVHVRSHTNNRPFKCNLCDKRCITSSHLKVHIVRWHTGERKHQCETCGKKFYAPDILRTHIRTHTGEKPFSCTICQRSFAQKGKLKQHSVIHTGATPFKCRHCDLLFSFGSSRRTHEKQIHGL